MEANFSMNPSIIPPRIDNNCNTNEVISNKAQNSDSTLGNSIQDIPISQFYFLSNENNGAPTDRAISYDSQEFKKNPDGSLWDKNETRDIKSSKTSMIGNNSFMRGYIQVGASSEFYLALLGMMFTLTIANLVISNFTLGLLFVSFWLFSLCTFIEQTLIINLFNSIIHLALGCIMIAGCVLPLNGWEVIYNDPTSNKLAIIHVVFVFMLVNCSMSKAIEIYMEKNEEVVESKTYESC